jgi:hypothetical protein
LIQDCPEKIEIVEYVPVFGKIPCLEIHGPVKISIEYLDCHSDGQLNIHTSQVNKTPTSTSADHKIVGRPESFLIKSNKGKVFKTSYIYLSFDSTKQMNFIVTSSYPYALEEEFKAASLKIQIREEDPIKVKN